MNHSELSQDEVKFYKREEDLHNKYGSENQSVTVNNQQYSFDTPQRQKDFNEKLCTTDEERSQYKSYREQWYRRARDYDAGSAPLAVTCELVSSCNLNCPMCYTITEEFQAQTVGSVRMMPWPIVKAIIDECAELGVPSMLFSWRGESSMYRGKDEAGNKYDFADVLAYARARGILETTSLTNGGLVDPMLAHKIIEAEPSWISFSIDGLEKNYNKIRTPENKRNDSTFNAFKNTISNIQTLVKIRNESGKTRPQIRCNSIYPPIAEDPKAYHDFMESIGVDWVTVNELLDFRDDDLPKEDILEDWACQYPFQRITIASNGTILPCTGSHDEYDDLVLGKYIGSKPKKIIKNGEKVVVDYPETNIKDAWNSAKINFIRDKHKNNKRCDINTCKNCRHGALKHGVDWVPDSWNMETMEWQDGYWME